jgi:predicted glycosyltransferase
VHLYKNAVRRLASDGHDVLVLGRDYECTRDLLAYYDLPFVIYGSCGTSKRSLLTSLPGHFVGIARTVRRFDPELVFGMGTYAAFGGTVARSPTVLILDSEPTSLDHSVSRPLATLILTPAAFGKDLGSKHYQFQGFKECAYLHPAVFESDPSVRSALGVAPDERYAIVRFNAFGSHHDVGQRGFSRDERGTLVATLAEHVTVFVSGDGASELATRAGVSEYDIHPARIHDALAEATLLVADSQTMVTEAALLGTPAIRSNSYVGDADMGNFVELERRGLVRNVRGLDEVIAAATGMLTDDSVEAQWQARRAAYVPGLVNLTGVIIELAEHAGALTESTGLAPYRSATST